MRLHLQILLIAYVHPKGFPRLWCGLTRMSVFHEESYTILRFHSDTLSAGGHGTVSLRNASLEWPNPLQFTGNA